MNDTTLDPANGAPSASLISATVEPAGSGAREEPGRLEVSDRVVEKIAGHAVTLVPDAAAAPRRVLGVRIGQAGPEDAANVSADVHDGIASVQATIAVRWPNSVKQVAAEVRERIRGEVTSLTGVEVDHVDVEVVSMTVSGATEPRVR
jgi:uncharacterized alkaline shock family protein YloU